MYLKIAVLNDSIQRCQRYFPIDSLKNLLKKIEYFDGNLSSHICLRIRNFSQIENLLKLCGGGDTKAKVMLFKLTWVYAFFVIISRFALYSMSTDFDMSHLWLAGFLVSEVKSWPEQTGNWGFQQWMMSRWAHQKDWSESHMAKIFLFRNYLHSTANIFATYNR